MRLAGNRILVANGPPEGFKLRAGNRVGLTISDQRMPETTDSVFRRRVGALESTLNCNIDQLA